LEMIDDKVGIVMIAIGNISVRMFSAVVGV
jgi:hypothetical protein